MVSGMTGSSLIGKYSGMTCGLKFSLLSNPALIPTRIQTNPTGKRISRICKRNRPSGETKSRQSRRKVDTQSGYNTYRSHDVSLAVDEVAPHQGEEAPKAHHRYVVAEASYESRM